MEIPLWRDLYGRRLDWAQDAYSKFLKEIDVTLAAEFQRQNEVTVALYGSTQVGKTTLLLKLLGVKAEQEVGRVLRGGRETAKSSTATAVRYSRSQDDHWYIGGQETKPLSDIEVIDALGTMRRDMEAGRYTAVDPVAVSIPRKFFAEENPLHHIRVLDLPGFDAASASASEGVMVANIARKHLPTADLIILIARVNDLGSLKPNRLRLDELKDWAAVPGRVRVVATHTVSDASFRRWLATTDNPSKEQVRALLAAEIRSLDMPVPESLERLLYPLEYGKSWDKLKDSAPDVHSKAEPLVDALLVDLYDDLRTSATLHGRLRMAFLFHHTVAAKVERELDVFDAQIQAATSRKALVGRKLKITCGHAQIARQSVARVLDEERALSEKLAEGMGLIGKVLVAHTDRLPEAKSVRALSEFIALNQEELDRQWVALSVQLHDLEPSLRLGPQPLHAAFDAVRTVLASYTFDWYFVNYERDSRHVLEANQRTLQAAKQAAERQLRQAADAQALRLRRDSEDKARSLSHIVSLQERLQVRWREQHDRLRDLTRARAAYEENSRYQVEKAKLFGVVLTKAFHAELSRRSCAVTAAPGPVEAFLRICYLKLLHSDFANLKNGSLNA